MDIPAKMENRGSNVSLENINLKISPACDTEPSLPLLEFPGNANKIPIESGQKQKKQSQECFL